MKNLKLLLIACVISGLTKAQDLIYKKDKTVLTAVLVDIGAEEIKYRDYNNRTGPMLVIKKNDLVKIVTERGKEILFEQNSSSSFDKKNAIKAGVYSWGAYHITFSYERSLAQSRSIEIQLGIIGVGIKPDNISEVHGAFTRIGYKFMHSPEHFTNKGKEFHLLKGAYFRPEITLGHFNETEFDTRNSYFGSIYYKTYPTTYVNFYALMLNVGQQWVIWDSFLIDVSFGAGYGGNSGEKRDFNYAVLGSNPWFMNAGLKVGVLIK